MDKQSSEIVKLTERISKDPKSKLFVPLAEEYKKIGDVEMAAYVLTEGLKNNPGYVTARSILGRLLLEQGDLAGARKELEEVVKVIPDNLLAQRKLGDICIFQNDPPGALKYYKTVLSLNSRDEEIASLIADIEAGNDISAKLPQPKAGIVAAPPETPQAKPTTKPTVTPQVKQEPKQEPQKTTPASQFEPAMEQPVVIEKNAVVPEAAPLPEQPTVPTQAEAELMPASLPVPEIKHEEPEEIFLVEPLEKEKEEEELHAGFSPTLEESSEISFASAAQIQGEQPENEHVPEKPLIPVSPDTREKDQLLPASETINVEREQPVQTPHQEIRADEPLEKSDDFTTDTLAELYIAQGFYEKAIDIYERMLTDKPSSRGLKDKLSRVKAMAIAPTQEAESVATDTDLFAEPQVYSAREEQPSQNLSDAAPVIPAVELPGVQVEARSPKAVVVEAQEIVLPEVPEQKAAQAKPLYTDFEPREYAPPKEEAAPESVQPALVEAPKSATAIRKDTLDRLESWLTNIKKES